MSCQGRRQIIRDLSSEHPCCVLLLKIVLQFIEYPLPQRRPPPPPRPLLLHYPAPLSQCLTWPLSGRWAWHCGWAPTALCMTKAPCGCQVLQNVRFNCRLKSGWTNEMGLPKDLTPGSCVLNPESTILVSGDGIALHLSWFVGLRPSHTRWP